MSKIHPEQIQEWTENPVTLEVVRILQEAIDAIVDAKTQCYVQFEPHKTQELMAGLQGSHDAHLDFMAILLGDWEAFIDETDKEDS